MDYPVPITVKSGEILKIHLSEQIKNLLFTLSEVSHSGYVIPGENSKINPSPKTHLPRAIARVQTSVGLIPKWTAGWTLRRTFATHLKWEQLSVDPVVIEKCLGHKMPRIMATYNKNEMLPERKEALNKWAQHVENFMISNNILIFKQAV